MAAPPFDFHVDLGVPPEQLPTSELTDLLRAIDAIVNNTVPGADPERDDRVNCCLVRINKQSTHLQLKASQPERAVKSMQVASNAINENRLGDLPPVSRDGVARLWNWSCKRGAAVKLFDTPKGGPIAVISPKKNLDLPTRMVGLTTLYGQVFRAGGKRPNVKLLVREGDPVVTCFGDLQIIKALAARLYQVVGLSGTAVWNTTSWKVESFTILRVLDYEQASLQQAFAELAQAAPTAWAEVTDVSAEVRRLRSEDEA
jgi:hypothetical protein